MKLPYVFCFLLLSSTVSAQTPFSADTAWAHLRVFSTEIGPRTMGSPAERRAMGYALQKFQEFGLTDAYLLPMSEAGSDTPDRTVNTNSGTAVGVLPGETDSIIVIGAHIDSATPEIAGANDDGSGSATVLELARVLAKRKNHSTIVFCLFGGEEQGLRGSSHFVKSFPQINRVRLMLQIDMANGSDWLIPLIEMYQARTPQWLVSAAYEECRAMGYSGLSYPTHFFTLNSLSEHGGIGSDHQPFLERGIPAIDFTSDVNDPIHTAQDDEAHFLPSGLKRSGDLVYRLVERFDASVPETTRERYFLLDLFSRPFFVPIWLLGLVVALAFVAGVFALVTVRRRRTETERGARPKIPALKLLLLAALVQIFVWFPENIVALLKGDRYPWFSNPSAYSLLGILGGIFGVWLALQISPMLRLSRDPYRWFLRTAIWLAVLTTIMALGGVRLMFYPAFALLLLSLAMCVRSPWLRLFLWAVSPHFLFRLTFNELSPLFARMLVLMVPSTSASASAIVQIVLVGAFTLWSYPFLLGFAAIWTDMRADVLRLKTFRTRIGFAVTALALVAYMVYLLTQPAVTDRWQQVIHADQTVTFPGGALRGSVHSNEYLGGTHIVTEGLDTVLSGRTRELKLFDRTANDSSWLRATRVVTARLDASGGYDLQLKLQCKYRPYTLTLTYTGPARIMKDIATTYAASTTDRSLTIRWYSFPDSILMIPVRFTSTRPDSVTETIEAVFTQPAVPVTVTKQHASVIGRTTVRRTELLHAPF